MSHHTRKIALFIAGAVAALGLAAGGAAPAMAATTTHVTPASTHFWG